jgi:hydroxymethylglutaryl-CoA synthase
VPFLSAAKAIPYAVKPTATIVGQALGMSCHHTAADLQFACKAGTAALLTCYGLVKSGTVAYGLAVGADTAQAKPGDVLEYSASAGSAAYIIGSDEQKLVATIDALYSMTTNTPDFWRRNHERYPSHAVRFTGEPAYIKHVIASTQQILDQVHCTPQDFDHVVFHQPNGKFPVLVARRLGFTDVQLNLGLLVSSLGNCYSASSLVGLSAVLDGAREGQKILLTSYGSGSGCDSMVITTTKRLPLVQKIVKTTQVYIQEKRYVSYQEYRSRMESL